VQSLQLESITAGADCAVLRVGGEVDVYTAPQLREHVIKLIANGTRHIVADLSDVEFLDSTGLGALVGSLKRLREQDGSLALVATASKILTVFRVTGLNRVFAFHPSVSEAIGGDPYWQTALAAEGMSAAEWCKRHEFPAS
jgi:anti-sigma B factor antagonist